MRTGIGKLIYCLTRTFHLSDLSSNTQCRNQGWNGGRLTDRQDESDGQVRGG